MPAFYLNKYKKSVKSIRIKAGDAIFCNMNTFHKSGKNISGLFRVSFISRFHDSQSDDFNSLTTLPQNFGPGN